MPEFNRDKQGRVAYTPEFHFANGKPMTEMELAYLCKFYEIDGRRTISFALGRTENSMTDRYVKLQKAGKVEYYKNLWDKQFEEE